MNYLEWFEAHAQKHAKIVDKLIDKGLNSDQIIEYFDYENMQKHEPDFCTLYASSSRCHDLKTLNCYLCGCPNFRFDDEGLEVRGTYTIKSKCAIHNGSTIGADNVVHQDCQKCTVPHHVAYISKHFDSNWRSIMSDVSSI